MKRHILLLLVALFVCHVLPAQIIGYVYDNETKESIPGANVALLIDGSSTVTDERGAFRLQAFLLPDTLVVRHVGYMTEFAALDKSNTQLTFYLERESHEIEEVVVNTGYQSIPKERATGSFTHIDNDLFNRSVSTDLISRLEGITNGLGYELPTTRGAPSSTPDLRIRGLSTIHGETLPLIVVDNFPYEGDINNINPNDVKSITVLKDAAAASIWGARAGNGVIVITTKGGAKQKTRININSYVSFVDKPDLYYDQRFLPPAELVELERFLFNRGMYTQNDWTAFTPATEVLFALDDGLIDRGEANRMLEMLSSYDIRDEALKYLYRRGVNQQYSVSIDGGQANHQYYISGGFDNNSSNIVGNDYERITLNARNDIQPVDGLGISTTINFSKGRHWNNGIGLLELAPAGMTDNPYTYARLADEEGNPLSIVKDNRYTYTSRALEMGFLDWEYRPLDELRTNDNTSESQEIRINTAIRYRLLSSLQVEGRYQYQNVLNSSRTHYPEESYYARNLINRFTQVDGYRPIPLGGILNRSSNIFRSHYGRLQLNYNKNWEGQHDLDGLAGFELRHEQRVGGGTSRLYGYDDETLTYVNNIDFRSSFPINPRSTGRISYGNAPGDQLVDRFVSYYGNVAYSFQRLYTLSGSVRWDASNIFGVRFNQQGVPLWSIGAAWDVGNERFVHGDWLNNAKLRITYGANGNAVRSISALPVVRYGSINSITQIPYASLEGVGNPDLSWEKVKTINLGLDIGLFGSRLAGTIEWYKKRSSNLIGEDLLDPTTGIFLSVLNYNLDNRRNYADLETRGVDFELNTVNLSGRLQWQTTLLFCHVRNRVTRYHAPQNPPVTDFLQSLFTSHVVEGNPLDQLYAIPWHGLDATGSPQVMVNGELGTDYNTYFNNLTYDDLIRIGVYNPPYFGSIRNTISLKGLSLSFNVIWKGGHKFRRSSVSYSTLYGTNRYAHTDYLNRWKQPGDESGTVVPSAPETSNLRRDHAYIYSEALFERADNIRLQDISLSYNLPEKYLTNTGFSQITFFAYARNLGVLWKATGSEIDPDARALYPLPVQPSLGIRIQL